MFSEVASDYIDHLGSLAMGELGLPGMALAVTDRERLLKASAYGVADVASQTPVTVSTRFEIGSLGKPFTVIPLMQLFESGIVDLHAPASRYLPWFRVNSDFPEITVHHLLNHTSGLPRGTDIGPHGLYESWALRDFQTVAAPGDYFCYSNIGYKTLGFLLERVTGQSLPDIIRERVLQPLGMAETSAAVTAQARYDAATGYASTYDDRPEHSSHQLEPVPWAPYATGDGAQVSTVGDMGAYLRLLLNRGQGPSERLLSERSLDLMTNNGVWTGGDYYGYGLATYSVNGREYIGHGGGNTGFRSAMVIDMEAGLGVVLLANRMGETDPLVEVAQLALTAACAGANGQPMPPLPATNGATHIQNASDYAGAYHSAGRVLTLETRDGRLLLQCDGGEVALERRSPDVFYALHPDFELALLEFGRAEGHVMELFHGPDWYAREGFRELTAPSYPNEWGAYTGHYRARNPELSNFRVAVRQGTLTLLHPWGNTSPLLPLESGRFRIGPDSLSPETLAFSAIADGKALRVDYTGCPYYRTFDS